jgi:MscS family membrane protein
MRKETDEEVDLTTIDALSKLARLTVIVIATLLAMQVLDFSISGVLAAGGIGGVAIGFAAKDLLANFFGGLTAYMDRSSRNDRPCIAKVVPVCQSEVWRLTGR